MKARVIALISTTILLLGRPIVCFSGIPTTDATEDNDDCDSSYPDVCIPPYPPDLNCNDISDKNFRVLYPDPHKLDREEDGIGCET